MEVRTEFEPWREAFNLALGGFATTLLIDAAAVPAFRQAIDTVRTPERLRYEGVRTGLPQNQKLDPQSLPGRLDYKTTPFSGALQDELERRFGYICVDSAAQATGHRMTITITGQTSQGSRGAHGGHGRANVLGFSARRRLDELDAQLETAHAELEVARTQSAKAAAHLDGLEAQMTAYRKVCEVTWKQIDVASLEAEQGRWAAVIDTVTAENPRIADIHAQIDRKRKEAADLREGIGSAKTEWGRLAAEWAATTDEVDAAQSTVDAADAADRALTADQTNYLDERFAAPVPTGSSTRRQELSRFDAALESASRRFTDDQQSAQQTVAEHRDNLRRTMTSFLDRWPSPNLLADPDHSLADFERILVELETSGLHELQTEWRDSLLKLSGNDLTNLEATLSRSLREIRDRIEPINAIMADLPFYDDEHRLQITPRENQSEVRRRFRKELREVRVQIEGAATDADRELAYTRMSRLINRLRRSTPDFAELVDVRNHVRVSAERVHGVTKQHVALYDHIGEKSGGESQELIAFIVGAALRYQLGDAGAERPRYAPVFLDEALIKADAHFTKRAIGAWRGLGFQLVIGAPNDKYSAIEPHVDVEYDILKDTRGRSWAKPKVALPEGL